MQRTIANMSSTFLSPDQALATLKEYESGDGLSLRELMDTRRNGQGGLTYNDFLVLPGKIDFPVSSREFEPFRVRGFES